MKNVEDIPDDTLVQVRIKDYGDKAIENMQTGSMSTRTRNHFQKPYCSPTRMAPSLRWPDMGATTVWTT